MNIQELIKNTAVQRLLLFSALVICILLWIQSCNSYKDDLNRSNNNFETYKDSTHKIILKNGQIEYERKMYLLEKNELEKYNANLKKELDKEKGNVKIISGAKVIIHDTIPVTDSTSKYKKIDDSTYYLPWNFEDDQFGFYKSISGNTTFILTTDSIRTLNKIKSTLTDYKFSFDIITGIKEESKGTYKIFIRTKDDNKNISFDKIEGAILDPNLFNKKDDDLLIFGPQLGFGYSNDQWDFFLGAGVTIKVFGIHF